MILLVLLAMLLFCVGCMVALAQEDPTGGQSACLPNPVSRQQIEAELNRVLDLHQRGYLSEEEYFRRADLLMDQLVTLLNKKAPEPVEYV